MATHKIINCQQCGGKMKKSTKTDTSFVVQIFGVILFIVGLGLLFLFPIGTLVGILIMIAAARMGYKKRKVWKCGGCGYFFERA
jgi:ribosomal protein L37AE/L43A